MVRYNAQRTLGVPANVRNFPAVFSSPEKISEKSQLGETRSCFCNRPPGSLRLGLSQTKACEA